VNEYGDDQLERIGWQGVSGGDLVVFPLISAWLVLTGALIIILGGHQMFGY